MRCDATVLGCLTKLMKALQILTPVEASYGNLSFDRCAKNIESKEILTNCEAHFGGLGSLRCLNKVKGDILASIKEHEVALSGLELGNVDGLCSQAM